MWVLVQRLKQWGKLQLNGLLQKNSGDWIWLQEKPAPIQSLSRSLWRGAVPSINFYCLLFLSAVIATFGLLANSAATIIGAMIVAPLMGPIIAIAYSTAVANRRMLKRASLTLFTGIILNITTAFVLSRFVGLQALGSEVLSRVNPTLIDLGVALAAGGAGAFAKSRKSVADALPGVAIAVALVPPLSVMGIGLAQASMSVTTGASLLFCTNLIGIIFSGGLVFLWQRYGTIAKAKGGLTLAILLLTLLGLPLGLSLRTLVLKERVRNQVWQLIRQEIGDVDIDAMAIQAQGETVKINLKLVAPANSVSRENVQRLKTALEQQLDEKISLRVRTITTQEFGP